MAGSKVMLKLACWNGSSELTAASKAARSWAARTARSQGEALPQSLAMAVAVAVVS
jgi:hypothetical protein